MSCCPPPGRLWLFLSYTTSVGCLETSLLRTSPRTEYYPPTPLSGPVQILLAPIKQLTLLSLPGCLVPVGRPFGWGPFKETRAWLLSEVSPRPPADKITPIPACDRLEVLFAGPTALLFTPLLRTILSIFLPQTLQTLCPANSREHSSRLPKDSL